MHREPPNGFWDRILQESYLEASRRLDEYLRAPSLPFFLWLRHITGQKLIDAHRRHLGAKKRDAGSGDIAA